MSRETKITYKMPNPEGVVAGGTATCRIPTGRRIHALYVNFNYNASTQNVADFTEIRVFVNGNVIQRFTGTERSTLNQFDGKGDSTDGILEIPFDRANLKTVAGEEQTALNTGVMDGDGKKITSVYLEIDLDSGMTIAASDLSVYAKQSEAIPGLSSQIPYIRREQRNPAGADTDFQISDLINPGVNAPDKIGLSRITFIPSTGSISELKIDRNTYAIFDRTDTLNRHVQTNGIRTPQSGYYTIDTGENGHGGELISLFGMTDFRYKLNVSAAMTLTCLSEYFGVLQG